MPTTQSPLRYPGGKSQFYSYVKEILAHNNLLGQTYMEPFAGGSGLALKLLLNGDVKRIIINDFDPAIYLFWYSILNFTDDFCSLIYSTPISPQEWSKQREVYLAQNTNDVLKLGFATFYLNRTNVSGVIKGGLIGGINQDGNFKMDARFNKVNLINQIRKISSFKDSIILLNYDAKELLQPNILRKFYKVFINFDPPYVRKGAQLYKNSFCEKDHRDLANLISQCGRKWIVTYDICPLITELYKNYRCSYLDVTYSIQNTKKSKEYIFFSDNIDLPARIQTIRSDCIISETNNSTDKLILE